MTSLFKKKTIKESISDCDNFIKSLKKEREKRGKGTDIEVPDRKKIEKNCGRSYLELFKILLIEAEWDEFLFMFQEKEKRSSWYSENWDRVVVNFARSPAKQELQDAVQKGKGVRAINEELKSGVSSQERKKKKRGF